MGYRENSAQRKTYRYKCKHIKRRSQINSKTIHFNDLEKEQQTKCIATRRKDITKLTEDMNKKDNGKAIQRINETKSLFFKKDNKIEEPLLRMINKKGERCK